MKTFIVDSFTNEYFKGNPAGVCLLEKDLDVTDLLNIAKELNFSETAFIKKLINKEDKYSIRFFSPKVEIPLCGHATLASAKVLFDKYNKSKITFVNIQNIDLPISQVNDSIVMEFPIYKLKPASVSDAMINALGLQSILGSYYNEETNIIMLEIESTQVLSELNPDFEALVRSHDSIHGVLITAQATNEYDFHSRFFWPWAGTNEDPVTGGTHTFLAPFWSERLKKDTLKSFQSSKRTGSMELEILSEEKFLIKAQAKIVFEGQLTMF